MSDNGKNLNLILSALDDEVSDITDINGGQMKISTILVPRWTTDYENNKPIFLTYHKDVISFYLEDNLNQIGFSGHLDVKNDSSSFDLFLGKIEDYFVVINITEYTKNESGEIEPLLKYEPYIFVATKVQQMTPTDSGNKIIRIAVEDYVTNILKTHSYGNLVHRFPDIHLVTNYKDFFVMVLEYVKHYAKINSNDEYELLKDVLYTSDMTIGGGVYNGNDMENDLSYLVQNSLLKVNIDDSIYQVVIQMMSDCCTTLKTPANFSSNNDVIGDVLIPFFFKEEYGDRWGFYNQVWKNGTDASIIMSEVNSETPNTKPKNDSVLVLTEGRKCPLVLRNMTMRDIYMPFHVAFSTNDRCCVYETIMPQEPEKEESFISLNGYYQNEMTSLQYIPISVPLLKKLKKNILFIDGNQGGGAGGTCALMFYSWIYDYYQNVFLKHDFKDNSQKIKGREYRIANLVPSFHLMQRVHGISHASSSGVSFSNQFDEMNSFSVHTETEDSLNEALRVVGKNICMFLLGNESYQFRIRGNMLRRPNEIIKFVYGGLSKDTQQTLSAFLNLGLCEYSYLYVKRIGHYFRGKDYWNDVSTCKIAEILK